MPSNWDWPEFQQDIHALLQTSKSLGDSWELVTISQPSEECSEYLRRTTKCMVNIMPSVSPHESPFDEQCIRLPEDPASIHQTNPIAQTLLVYEFHVLFHPSYRVPALYFNATKPNGSQLSLDEAWQLLAARGIANLTSVITEMHHPALGTPFLALHPCRTDELLDTLPHSTNRVLTFLSTLGPAVNLEMDVRYGLEVDE